MPSLEELQEQEWVFFQKIRELRTYLMDTREIQGHIAVMSYRYNSGIDVSHELVQMREKLKRELKEKNAELRRNHHLSPGQVEGQLRQYEHEITKIERQVKNILPWCYRDDIQDAGQEQSPPEMEGAGNKCGEQYEQEPEQIYKHGQEKKCEDKHSETINRQHRQKGNYDRLRKLYEDGGPQHPAPGSILPLKEVGQGIMIPKFWMPGSGSGKVTYHSYGEEIHDFEKACRHISAKFPYHSGGYGNPYGSGT